MVFVSLQGGNIATKKELRRLQPRKRFSSRFTCNLSLVLAANCPVVTKLVPASRSKSENFLVCSRQLDFMKCRNTF